MRETTELHSPHTTLANSDLQRRNIIPLKMSFFGCLFLIMEKKILLSGLDLQKQICGSCKNSKFKNLSNTAHEQGL